MNGHLNSNADGPTTPSHPLQLLIVKTFFHESKKLLRIGDRYSLMRASMSADFAVEQMLNALIGDFSEEDLPDRSDVTWEQLWQKATGSVKAQEKVKRLPNYKDLKRLHEERNLVQHQGHVPDAVNLARYIERAEGMLCECFQKAYGFDFRAFSVSDTIRNPDLRQLAEDCQSAIDQGYPHLAIMGVSVVFDKIKKAVLRKDTWNPLEGEIRSLVGQYFSDEHFPEKHDFGREFGKLLQKEFDKVEFLERAANLGISLASFREFETGLGSIFSAETYDRQFYFRERSKTSLEEYDSHARYCVDFFINLLTLLQDVYSEELGKIRIQIPLSEQTIWTKRGGDQHPHEWFDPGKRWQKQSGKNDQAIGAEHEKPGQ